MEHLFYDKPGIWHLFWLCLITLPRWSGKGRSKSMDMVLFIRIVKYEKQKNWRFYNIIIDAKIQSWVIKWNKEKKEWFEMQNQRNKVDESGDLQSVQSLSWVGLFVFQRTAVCQAFLSIINSQSLLKLMSIDSVMLSNHFVLYHPLLLLPSISASIRAFSNDSVFRIRWPKYWSFSFGICPSNEYSGLTTIRIDWLDILAA